MIGRNKKVMYPQLNVFTKSGKYGLERASSGWGYVISLRKALPLSTFFKIAVLSAIISLAGIPFYPPGCDIAAVGIFSGVFALALACQSGGVFLAIPWFSVVLFVIQNLVGHIYLYWYPWADPLWPISLKYSDVIVTASLASLSFFAGIMLPTFKGLSPIANVRFPINAKLVRSAHWMLLFGYILAAMENRLFVVGGPIQFFVHLLAMLRLVGAGVLITSSRNVFKWLVFMVIAEFFMVASIAIVHDFVLIIGSLICLLGLARHWKWQRLAIVFLFGVITTHYIQQAKIEYRGYAWFGKGEYKSLSSILLDNVFDPIDILSKDSLDITVSRINQSKITEAIFNRVPQEEPFALGKTIWDALYASLIPRFLFPSKAMGADKKRFFQYTGHFLQEGVSMNLGILGEGYANFGKYGAICVLFMYGFIFGLGYRFVIERARSHPIFWVWFPYVFYWWPKTEGGIAATLNYSVKAVIMFLAMVLISKVWQQALGLKIR